MKSMVTIRAFMLEDIDSVIELLQDVSCYRPDAETVPALANAFATLSDRHGCVALCDGRLVGFGSVFVLHRIRGGCSGVIEDMVVAADLRGQGIGKLILNWLLMVAREHECFKITLESSPRAERFYSAAGFVKTGRFLKLIL